MMQILLNFRFKLINKILEDSEFNKNSETKYWSTILSIQKNFSTKRTSLALRPSP